MSLLSLLFYSCTDSFEPDSSINKNMADIASKTGIDQEDPGLNFAFALANGLKNESVRQFIFDKTNEKFDGDYNFLYITEKDESLGDANSRSMTFEEALFGSGSAFRTTGSDMNFNPLLQVALRGEDEDVVNLNQIDSETIIIYVPANQDLEKNPKVPAIKSNGDVFEYDIQIVPEEPVLLVSLNERLVGIPKNGGGESSRIQSVCAQARTTPYFSDATNDYYFYDQVYCDTRVANNPGGVPSGGSADCDRSNSNKYDHINQVKFTSMKIMREAESWRDGAPEVFFFALTNSSDPNLKTIRKNIRVVDRSKWKDCGIFSCTPEWYYLDLEVFYWDREDFSESVKFVWFEYDPAESTTHKTSYSSKDVFGNTTTTEVSVTVTDEDYPLGETPVRYCEKASYSDFKIQTTGWIDFGLRLDD